MTSTGSVWDLPVAERTSLQRTHHLAIAKYLWVAPVREVAVAIREWRVRESVRGV
jgi:hypothetical protein